METAFAGTYFSGKSSWPHVAQVWLEPGQLRIDYQEPDQAVPVRIYWPPSRIRQEVFADRHTTLLHYGDYPAQTLEIISPDFEALFEKQYRSPQPLTKPPELLPASNVKPWFWLIAGGLLLGAIGFYFWGLPFLADRVAQAIPQSADEYLGKRLYTRVIATEKQEKELTYYVRGFYRQLRVSGSYNIQVAVIDNKNPNAFALPGGYLVVQRGLLHLMQQPEELAVLLGHESGHVELRHTTRALFRSLSSYLFISLIFGDLSGVTAVVLQNADVLKRLEYSRRLEREADQFSFNLLRRNHIHPRGLVLLFERLKTEPKKNGGDTAHEFLTTHPALDSRIREMQTLIRKYPYAAQPPDSLQYYWQKIKVLSQGDHLKVVF